MTNAWAKLKIVTMAAMAAVAMSGCLDLGGSTDDATLPGVTPPVGGVNPPSISGQPAGAVTMGTNYSFTPTASDPDGDRLTFSVQGLPRWATFNIATGNMSGMPVLGDEGIYANIEISVTDGTNMVSMPQFSVTVTQSALGSTTLSWNPPTLNSDGSMLSDLTAYKLYYGVAQGDYPNEIYIPDSGISSYVVDNLIPNTYYFVATAIKQSGAESEYSNVAVKTVSAN